MDDWIETRGLVLRADGVSLMVTRGTAAVMPIPTAVLALDSVGLALWLAAMSWRPLHGVPRLRPLRRLAQGAGTWEEARAGFLARWSPKPKRPATTATPPTDQGAGRADEGRFVDHFVDQEAKFGPTI